MQLVSIGAGHQLAPAAAASYLRARAAGCPAGVTSSYRDPARQAAMRAQYEVELAAWRAGRVPDKPTFVARVEASEHVTGAALDLPASPRAWIRAHPEHGFAFTDPTEAWHVAYRLVLDRHAGDLTPPAPLTPTPVQEDEMKPWFFRRHDGAVAIVTPTGVRHLTLAQWQVWENLGVGVFPPGMGAMDDGPFLAVVESLGGWAG